MKNTGVIAILGGMGPEASAKMLQVLIDMASSKFGAKRGQDFPEIILDSVPVPDFFASEKNLELAKTMLKQRVRKLNAMRLSCFAIACNTAHIMLEDLMKETRVPFVSIVDELVKTVSDSGIKKVGLLASPMTINAGLFQSSLSKAGIDTIVPDKRINEIEMIIRKVISGKSGSIDVKKLTQISLDLRLRGADGIILGCIELPLIFPKNLRFPVFDSIEILSKSLLERGYKNGKV